MGIKRSFLKSGKPAFQVKSLGHAYKIKRIFSGKNPSYVVASFRIGEDGKMTFYTSEDMDYHKEFIFIDSDPHIVYKIGTMLREIGNFGIQELKKKEAKSAKVAEKSLKKDSKNVRNISVSSAD